MTRGSFCTASMSPSASTRPFVQHRDRAGDRAHELHVVLDDDHRVLAGERQQQLRGALGFLRRHAGHRLVDQQQLGLLHQQHADLEPLLLPVRQRAGERVRADRSARSTPSTSSMRSRSAGVRRRDQHPPERLVARPAPARGSRTPSGTRTPSASGTCGRCRPARSPARSAPAGRSFWPNQAEPSSGRVLPVITSIIVVLPAPFGPMMQRSSPGST